MHFTISDISDSDCAVVATGVQECADCLDASVPRNDSDYLLQIWKDREGEWIEIAQFGIEDSKEILRAFRT